MEVQVVWAKYVEAMREAKFNSARSVYIASGLLTYGSHEGEALRFLSIKLPPAVSARLKAPRGHPAETMELPPRKSLSRVS